MISTRDGKRKRAGNGNRTRMSRHPLRNVRFTYEIGRTRKVLDIAGCYDKL